MTSAAILGVVLEVGMSRNERGAGDLPRCFMSTINNFDWTGIWARPRVLFGEGSALAGGQTGANYGWIWWRVRCSFVDRSNLGRFGGQVHAAIHCPTINLKSKRDT